MSVVSLAIVGKNNTPIYLREFDNVDAIDEAELFGLSLSTTSTVKQACSVRQQFILHAALDKFEQLAGPPPACAWRAPGVTGTDAMLVGFLCPVDDMRVYGYMTTTQIKFLLTVRDGYHEDIQKLFAKIHAIYVGHILNPFSPLNAPISSNRFDQQIQQTVNSYNESMM
ncbi:hypothetical protein FisN_2Hh538 [Fistulifera solaris]|uniref:Trafficking protein particle complex subunit n=1 Tax=Fistulifera solaris TaxID=1519565 RepID=A0A1Z5JIF9_FISSO|nr:hypothetical protein FisN_2Hh538 [Fistulifera solaris]|eukprot:GAX13716.1 hypothetical protein FisN_2Hh538 [Fistulifera solaris]